MQSGKHPLASKCLLLIVLVLLFCEGARGQVMVDVSKITCNQFVTYQIQNPKYIIAWLAGYYHGTRRDMTVDLNALIADADKVEAYCFKKPEVTLVQAMKTILGISLGP
jgi:HdeA/HdeB family